MSGLIASQYVVPGGIFLASLLGSVHCAGMCGGLVVVSCKSARSMVRYHLGRGAAYVALGAAAGSAGGAVLGRAPQLLASLALAISLAAIAVSLLSGRLPHWSPIPRGLIARAMSLAGSRPWALGALSALLPCGWLHTFVLGAAATQSPAAGGLYMGAFWLGTVPALSGAPWLARRLIAPLGRKAPAAAAIVLLVAGFSGLGLRVAGFLAPSEAACPMHSAGALHR